MGNLEKCPAEGKVRFATKKEALAKIHRTKDIYSFRTGQRVNRLRRKRKEKRAYYCQHCEGWHLTSLDYDTLRQIRDDKKKNLQNHLDITKE